MAHIKTSILDGIDVEEFVKQFHELESYVPEQKESEFSAQLDKELADELQDVSWLTNELMFQFYHSDYNSPDKHFSKIQINTLKTLVKTFKNSIEMVIEDQKRSTQ